MDNKACNCGSTNTYKSGVTINTKGKRQRWHCKDCGKVTLGDFVQVFGAKIVELPPILEVKPKQKKVKSKAPSEVKGSVSI
jgi:transposase-like protein